MGFSNDWQKAYSNNKYQTFWPWSDLVSYVYRYTRAPIEKEHFKVLELGCGTGANIRLFDSFSTDYYAIDGSKTVVETLKYTYPLYAKHIVAGDFTAEIPFDEKFDLIIDRCSLTFNTTKAIKNALQLVFENLKKGGKFIGVDWYAVEDDRFLKEEHIAVDEETNIFSTGYFSKAGQVHFSTREHIEELLVNFDIEAIMAKRIEHVLPPQKVFAYWDFVARKRK